MAKQVTSKAAPAAEKTGVGKTRNRAVSKVSAQVAAATSAPAGAQELSHAQIAEHAYELYLARGASEGGAVGDWLRAEHELRARISA